VADHRLTRRGALALLGALALPGCAGLAHRDAPRPELARRALSEGRLSVVVFEHVPNAFPFHTALIVEGPQGRILYDPGGFWDDGLGGRVNDVTFNLTPAREAAYLNRDYFGHRPGTWRVYRFDRALPPAQAEALIEAAAARAPVPSGACAIATAGVLRQLQGFEGTPVNIFPSVLLRDLRARGDMAQSELLQS